MTFVRDNVEYIRLTTEEFLREKIDVSAKGLEAIPGLLKAGDVSGAEHVYAEFVRASLKPDKFFSLPFPPGENYWRYPGETDRAVFERLSHSQIMSVNFMHDFGEEGIQWESNPMLSKYREWTWQLNRHHEFISLARLYRETGDEDVPYLFMRLWHSWREQCFCPLKSGPGATEAFRTIEIGIRMRYSWHCALHAFYRSPAFTDHDICDYFASMWENANRLRYFHVYTGNWLLMEMAGLFSTGVLYPWICDADMWKRYALDKIKEQLVKQVYPDGFQAELSTGYHSVVVSNTLSAVDIAMAMDEPIGRELIDLAMPAYEMYVKLSDPGLCVPGLNDADIGSIVKVCAKAAELFPDRDDFRFFATERKEGTPPDQVNTVMPYSGMTVFRDNWTADSQWLFFESAPFGLSHQHEDKLSVLLYAYGKRLLKDTGNHVYDSSQMRAYVLSGRAHNTVMVDGEGQNRRGKYRWRDEFISQLSDLKVKFGEEIDAAFGTYDEGYGPEYIDVTHKRKVLKVKNNPAGLKTFYIVIDRLLSGDGKEHAYAAHWQIEDVPVSIRQGMPSGYGRSKDIAPDYQAPGRRGCVLTADYGDNITLTLISGENYTVRCGSISPFIGWRKPDNPAPSIDFTAFGLSSRIVTLLYPSDDGCPIKNIEYKQDVNDSSILIRLFDGSVLAFIEPSDE